MVRKLARFEICAVALLACAGVCHAGQDITPTGAGKAETGRSTAEVSEEFTLTGVVDRSTVAVNPGKAGKTGKPWLTLRDSSDTVIRLFKAIKSIRSIERTE